MVKFEPEKTEIIFFDLEWYVPLEDRKTGGASLKANPHKKGQFLLGGVFTKNKPLLNNQLDFKSFWIWREKSEKDILEQIYKYVKSSWDSLKDKEDEQADLILCGHGISRFDVPILYIKSIEYKVDFPEKIFENYYNTKIVDLSNVAIPFFSHDEVMYPKPINSIYRRFGINEEKSSGKNVWELYDNKELLLIEERTKREVDQIIKIYDFLLGKIYRK
jgi:hypothetical protein